MKERGTIVEDADRMLTLHPVKPDSIQLLAEELFPERNNRNSLPQPKAYHSADYDAVIWIRNFHQNGNAVVNLYFLSQGFFWELASETELRPIPANQFMETLLRTLKGE